MAQTKSFTVCPRSCVVSWFAILFSLAVPLRAVIPVLPSGTGIITFDAAPGNTNWSSRHVLPNSGTAVTTVEGLDPLVQTNIPTTITTALPTTADGAANNNAAFRSGANFIYTRPTGNTYQLLMGQFRNDIGDAANQIIIEFDGTSFNPPAGAEQAEGWRVYSSLSSESNNWIVIPELSGFEPNGHTNVTVNLASNWLSGATLYLLFADDNAQDFTDTGYSIDNFSIVAVPATTTPLAVTNSPQNIAVDERGMAIFMVG